MGKYKKYITKGIDEPLSEVKFHTKSPIKRILMLEKKNLPEAKTHLAVHFVDVDGKKIEEYTTLHKHTADEINLILSYAGKLKYEIQLENEIYKVSSPATIFIPKGMKHRAKAVSGKGLFVCIILSNKYRTT